MAWSSRLQVARPIKLTGTAVPCSCSSRPAQSNVTTFKIFFYIFSECRFVRAFMHTVGMLGQQPLFQRPGWGLRSLPDSATLEMCTPCSAAMKPRMEKTTKPAKKLVPLLMSARMMASLGTQGTTGAG